MRPPPGRSYNADGSVKRVLPSSPESVDLNDHYELAVTAAARARNKLMIGAAMRGGDPGLYAGGPVPPPMAVNARGELVSLDSHLARAVAKAYNVPDAVVGIPTPRWRRIVQRFTRRARQRARRG